MQRVSQMVNAPLASNPANGIHNIPMQGGGGAGGLQPQELLDMLHKIERASTQEAPHLAPLVQQLIGRSQNPEIQQKLNQIANALHMSNDPRKQSVDPATGKKDPTAAELAGRLVEEIKTMQANQPAPAPSQAQAAHAFNYHAWRLAAAKSERPTKKKTRGNPFRVLMGKIGKLLDKGVAKNDIKRFLLKENIWNEETIDKAINIVKDYNRKKHRKDRSHASSEQRQSATGFNYSRFASDSKIGEEYVPGEEGASLKPDYAKRSVAELMARAAWLQSLQSYDKNTPQGDGRDAADTSGVAKELKAIRAALKARGFDEDETTA